MTDVATIPVGANLVFAPDEGDHEDCPYWPV